MQKPWLRMVLDILREIAGVCTHRPGTAVAHPNASLVRPAAQRVGSGGRLLRAVLCVEVCRFGMVGINLAICFTFWV